MWQLTAWSWTGGDSIYIHNHTHVRTQTYTPTLNNQKKNWQNLDTKCVLDNNVISVLISWFQ